MSTHVLLSVLQLRYQIEKRSEYEASRHRQLPDVSDDLRLTAFLEVLTLMASYMTVKTKRSRIRGWVKKANIFKSKGMKLASQTLGTDANPKQLDMSPTRGKNNSEQYLRRVTNIIVHVIFT